jgi:carbamoyl-phosphate synthase small subunit
MKQAILLLQDGTLFKGKAFGYQGTSYGEIAFNTSMTGYQEIITDPSYTGQILILNNCYTGNYGTKLSDVESKGVTIKGLICKNISTKDSREQSDKNLQDYLSDEKIVCIYDIDTRALVSHVRQYGAMNCIVSTDESVTIDTLKDQLNNAPSMEGLELSSTVTTNSSYEVGESNSEIKIAVMDYGVKQNIINCMVERGAFCKVFPAHTTFEEINKFNPDAYFLSNGPGDPSSMQYAVKTVQQMLNTNKPLFGICLGNQLLGLAMGINTQKMHRGHRGANHPVLNSKTQQAEISTQNHGFSLIAEEVLQNEDIIATHINLNDGSIEGIRLKNKPAFSVQYHPEAAPGPHDSRYLFDDFMELIKEHKMKN